MNYFDNPLLEAASYTPSLFRAAKNKKESEENPIKPYDPQEEASKLSEVVNYTVGGLGYLGDIIDKVTGARALRGLLGGRPEELLSLVPLSDTFGWTKPENIVSGRDLVEKAGLVGSNEEGLDFGDVAGFGAEVLLDPSTYLTFGGSALTKAGRAAQKAGVLPSTRVARMKGFAIGSPELTKIAPLVGKSADELTDVPLGGLVGPGGLLRKLVGDEAFGTGSLAQKIGGKLDSAEDYLKYTAPVRFLRKYFDQRAGGTTNEIIQREFEHGILPTQQKAVSDALGEHAKQMRQLDAVGALNAPDEDLVRAVGENRVNWPGVATPGQLEAVNVGLEAQAGREALRRKVVEMGGEVAWLPDHAPRYKADLPGELSHASPFAKTVQSGVPSAIPREEILRNLDTPTVDAMAQDPFVSGKARAAPDASAARDHIMANYLGNPSPGTPEHVEAFIQATKLADWLWRMPPEHVAEGKKFFGNPLHDNAKYMVEIGRRAATLDGTHNILAEMAKEADGTVRIFAGGHEEVTLLEAIKDLKMDYSEATPGGTVHFGRKKLASKLGLTPDQLDRIAVKKTDFDALKRFLEPTVNPATASEFTGVIDTLTNLFKAYVTVPFPAFHARNAVTGLWQNWLIGAHDPSHGGSLSPVSYLKSWMDGWGLARGKIPAGLAEAPIFNRLGVADDDQAAKMIHDWMYQYGVAGPRGLSLRESSITGPLGTFDEVLQNVPGTNQTPASFNPADWLMPRNKEDLNPLNVRGVWSKESKVPFVRQGDALANDVDFANRASAFVAKLKQGYEPEVAAAISKGAHYDYSTLSGFEKSVMRRLVPFYSFSRKNMPFVISSFLEDPGPQAALLRAGTGGLNPDNQFVPSYLAEGLAIPASGDQEGEGRYISSIGSPIEDELLKAIGSLAKLKPADAIRQVAAGTNPLLRGPFEWATGMQLHTGRKLSDLRPMKSTTFGVLSEDQSRVPSMFLSNTPLTRFFSAADKLVDTFGPDARRTPLETAVNLLSGVRVTDVDLEKHKEIAGRQAIEQALTGKPGIRIHSRPYAKKEDIPNLNQAEVELLRLQKTLEQKAKQRERLRKKEESR